MNRRTLLTLLVAGSTVALPGCALRVFRFKPERIIIEPMPPAEPGSEFEIVPTPPAQPLEPRFILTEQDHNWSDYDRPTPFRLR